jgi:hypothetical protein
MNKYYPFIFCLFFSSFIFGQSQLNLFQVTKHPDNDYHPRWSNDGQ